MKNNDQNNCKKWMIPAVLAGVILAVIFFDQLTKWLTVIYLEEWESFPLWKDVLHFTFVKNKGAAFGMLSNHRWVFMLFSTIAILGISVYLFGFCKERMWVRVSLAMIVGGGIGNMIDRIALGYVVDFIDVTLINFAVFNVADSFVTIGAGMLIVYYLAEIIREERANRRKKAETASEVVDQADTEQEESTDGE